MKIYNFLFMCTFISQTVASVGIFNDYNQINKRGIQQWGTAERGDENNITLGLGNISSYAFLTPYKVFDSQLNHSKFGYVDVVIYLTKINAYKIDGKFYSSFKLDFKTQFIPGVATPSSDKIHDKKYHNYSIDSSIYTKSYTANTSTIDYWPVNADELGFPPIIVTKNHSRSTTLGMSFDVTNSGSANLKYDVFGLTADRGVKINLNGQYVDAYSVTQTFQTTDPAYINMGYTSVAALGEGAFVSIKDFSEDGNSLKTGQKTMTYRSGVLFNVYGGSNNIIKADIIWNANHSVRSKNIFGVFQFYTRLYYDINLKFSYSITGV